MDARIEGAVKVACAVMARQAPIEAVATLFWNPPLPDYEAVKKRDTRLNVEWYLAQEFDCE